jgi:hypothetical protein
MTMGRPRGGTLRQATRFGKTAWLADYRRAVESSPYVKNFPYADMQAIFARLRATPHPWRSFPLPWGADTSR